MLGLGPLEPLLSDPTISDILVNGAKSVFVERRGSSSPPRSRFNDDQHLMNIIDRIVSAVGRRIDESSPMVDARLADGSRVNAIIPPLAIDGPMLSIRRFAVERLGVADLLKFGTLTQPVADVLRAIVIGRLNVVISGGTGAGKTTMLNVLSGFIPATERIVTIEDSAELQLQQPHVAARDAAQYRGQRRSPAARLLRIACACDPIGSWSVVRGGEALDMQAMNTGHDSSLTTVHANTPGRAGPYRDHGVHDRNCISIRALRAQIASVINIVIQCSAVTMVVAASPVPGNQRYGGGHHHHVGNIHFPPLRRRRRRQYQGRLEATGVVPAFHQRGGARHRSADRRFGLPDGRRWSCAPRASSPSRFYRCVFAAVFVLMLGPTTSASGDSRMRRTLRRRLERIGADARRILRRYCAKIPDVSVAAGTAARRTAVDGNLPKWRAGRRLHQRIAGERTLLLAALG